MVNFLVCKLDSTFFKWNTSPDFLSYSLWPVVGPLDMSAFHSKKVESNLHASKTLYLRMGMGKASLNTGDLGGVGSVDFIL